MEQVTVGGIPIINPAQADPRFVAIIWGPIGAGKTPLTATAPVPILYLMLDIGGETSINHRRETFDMIDLSNQTDTIVDQFERLDRPFMLDLNKVLASGKYKTLVLDSATSFLDKSLTRGITRSGPLVTKGVKPELIAPGLQGYGARSMLIRQCVMNLHTLCARNKVNFILTAHEKIEYNTDGSIDLITLLLGGEAFVQVPKHFGEIWRLDEKEGKKTIFVKSFNRYKPCRSRMFNPGPDGFSFQWKFDTFKWQGDGIETWLNRWKDNQCSAIPMPK